MVGGVMTTVKANNSRLRGRHRTLIAELRPRDHQQEFTRHAPGAADRLWPAMIATRSLGSASPPVDG